MANVNAPHDLLRTWDITAEEFSEIVAENPSMRGLMFGFVAEYKVKKQWLLRPEITNLERPRSHDRTQKCDFRFDYRGTSVKLEVKSLDTPKVRLEGGVYRGTFQCNASDTTEVTLPNGKKVTTNCLAVGGFDVFSDGVFIVADCCRSIFLLVLLIVIVI